MYGGSVPAGLTIALIVVGVPLLGSFFVFYPLRRQGFRPFRWPPFESGASFDAAHSLTFRGGARVGLFNATAPLVTLSCDQRHASLQGAMFIRAGVDRRNCRVSDESVP